MKRPGQHTHRFVIDKFFSFAMPGEPPSRFKRLLIKKLIGWRVELLP